MSINTTSTSTVTFDSFVTRSATRSASICSMPPSLSPENIEKYSTTLDPQNLPAATSAKKAYKENVLPPKQVSAPHLKSYVPSALPPLLDLSEVPPSNSTLSPLRVLQAINSTNILPVVSV